MMSKYSKQQRAGADQVLGGKHDATPHVQAWSPGGPQHQSDAGPEAKSHALLDQLKARVVTGETLDGPTLLNAKNTLDVNDQAELAAFLEN